MNNSNAQRDSTLMVGFYNCENLFDTVHDFRKKDFEYLPGNARKWDSTKYFQKLNHLARAIASMNEWQGPDFLGLCEVENAQCLKDLLNETNLKNLGYGFIHQESNDERGIDVACIYKREKMKLLEEEFIKIDFGTGKRPTRDVLRTKFLIQEDTIHVFVNHWPSRFGGEVKSREKRIATAKNVRESVDSLFLNDTISKIVLLGDFNDGPEDESINELLYHDSVSDFILYNTSTSLFKKGEGSHKYQDEWNLFDQIIVSKELLTPQKGISYVSSSSQIHDQKEWLSETDLIYGGLKPFRSYYGKKFINGYSDHYAVSLKLRF